MSTPSSTPGSSRKKFMGQEAVDYPTRSSTEKDKKKKFSLQSKKLEARKLWEVFRNESDKRFTVDDTGRGGSLGGPAGVADSGRMIGSLQDKLELFERDNFDVDNFTQEYAAHLTEKGLNALRGDLVSLQDHCEEEVQRVFHSHYPAFVDAWEGVGELEIQFQQLKTLITGSCNLVHDLKRASEPTSNALDLEESSWSGPTILPLHAGNESLEQALEELDVAIAERDLISITKLLHDAEERAIEASPQSMSSVEGTIQQRRETVVSLLERLLKDPTIAAPDQHKFFQVLAEVAGDVHALNILLGMHTSNLRQAENQLLKPQLAGGSDPSGTDYVGSLSQCLLQTLSRAIEDNNSIFSSQASGLQSTLVVWARAETVHCCNLIKEHALSAHAGPSGLEATVHCVSLALVYAMGLEENQQLSLVNLVRTELWTCVEGVLEHYFQAGAISIQSHVREEVDNMVVSPAAWSAAPPPSSSGPVKLSSASRLFSDIDLIVDILNPIGHPSLRTPILKGVDRLFGSFIAGLSKGLKDHMGDAMVSSTLEGIMESVALMVERSIPKSLSKLESSCGQMPGPVLLQHHIDNLARQLGMQEVS